MTDLDRLIGQHPAALRSVSWGSDAPGADQLAHLELETKHGHVVIFDHISGDVHAHPPRPPGVPPGANGRRQWRDLTEELPMAFNGRPRLEAIDPLPGSGGSVSAWRFELTNQTGFVFHLDPATPVLTSDS